MMAASASSAVAATASASPDATGGLLVPDCISVATIAWISASIVGAGVAASAWTEAGRGGGPASLTAGGGVSGSSSQRAADGRGAGPAAVLAGAGRMAG